MELYGAETDRKINRFIPLTGHWLMLNGHLLTKQDEGYYTTVYSFVIVFFLRVFLPSVDHLVCSAI